MLKGNTQGWTGQSGFLGECRKGWLYEERMLNSGYEKRFNAYMKELALKLLMNGKSATFFNISVHQLMF